MLIDGLSRQERPPILHERPVSVCVSGRSDSIRIRINHQCPHIPFSWGYDALRLALFVHQEETTIACHPVSMSI